MVRRYGTFVLRYWRLDGRGERVAIEHIQSGARTRVASFGAAEAWIAAQVGSTQRSENGDMPPGGRPEGDPGPPSTGDEPGR